MRRPSSIRRSARGGNLLVVMARLTKKDREIVRLAMEKCGSNSIPEKAVPLLSRKRAIAAVCKLSKVCGYGTAAIRATLKKLLRPP
jgi:hypothetical protein